MPTPALLLLIATLVPLASFALLVFLGKRLGYPLAGWVATGAIGAAFLLSMWAMTSWFAGNGTWGMGEGPINIPIPFLPAGQGLNQSKPGFLDLGIYIDSLTIVMFAMVSGVSLLIHIFSIGYMADDKRFPRFFTYLSLFCFSMLGLVLGGTLLQLLVFWELVGLCSYLLIGFWYEKKSASDAAIKAFVVNRIGDFGFLIGLGVLFYHLGNVTLPEVWAALDVSKLNLSPAGIRIAGAGLFTSNALTIMGIGLFCGAIGKSAQFPLHVWLPDAMEGPTPVSALIHAATMVAAGVYLVARIFPILTPDAKLFIAIIGLVTLTMAALIAVVQSDIKKVLAFSTLSQLGYMMLAMGVGSWVGGTFHLITHAFFKALLFLGAGSVIIAAHHHQELREYGGLWRKIPITAITFAIGVLAIAGMPGLSGYYSKDIILAHAGAFASLAAHEHHNAYYWLFFIIPALIASVTAFYMTRCWMLTFAGKPRNDLVYQHASERPIMWWPLVGLAFMSLVGGYDAPLNIKGLIGKAITENTSYINRDATRSTFAGFSQAWPADLPGNKPDSEAGAPIELTLSQQMHERGEHLVRRFVFWTPFLGITCGVVFYWRAFALANVLMRIAPLRWIHTWLYRRMYFDELYMGVFVAIALALCRLGAAIDRYVIDGLLHLLAYASRRLSDLTGLNDRFVIDGAVNGMAAATQGLGAAARALQTGRIRLYVTVALGMVAIAVAAVVAMMVL